MKYLQCIAIIDCINKEKNMRIERNFKTINHKSRKTF